MDEVKTCKYCKLVKHITEFSKQKFGKGGVRSNCKSCCNSKLKLYREENPDAYKPKTKEQIIKNNQYMKNKLSNDPIYREKYLKQRRKRSKSDEYKSKARLQRKKWLENPANRIAKNMRDRMRAALVGKSKKDSTLNMTGISFEELKNYLESKFLEGMSWNNYGHDGWHIDHIIPCSYFDFTKEDHQKICFYYKNLQPMWCKDNISKGNKITIDNIQDFVEGIKRELNI